MTVIIVALYAQPWVSSFERFAEQGAVDKYPGVRGKRDGERISGRFVQGALPPGGQLPVADRPAQSGGGERAGGGKGEQGYLHARTAFEGCRLQERGE